MNLSICSFASSSSGNCYLIKSEETAILVDAGITAKAVDAALASQRLGYADLGGICITHEHTDHIKCLHTLVGDGPFSEPVFATEGTREGILAKTSGMPQQRFETIRGGDTFVRRRHKSRVFRPFA